MQIIRHLSRVSSSRCVRSQAMYSRAASVIRGHQETSRLTCRPRIRDKWANQRRRTSFLRFSAISSIPSSVIFEQPERERMVRLGREWTAKDRCYSRVKVVHLIRARFYSINL
jgi:hypothetical protein